MRLFISTVWMACVLAACGGDAASPGAEGQDQPLGIAALGQPQPGPAGPVARAPDGTPTRLALLVGINTYPNLTRFSQLKGAANDVARMHTLLTTRYAFPPENVRVLLDEAATREGILAAFREHLVANARAGDIVVFHFSGHGSRLPDAPGGDETDGIDETLVPTDSDRHGARDIRDDDLEALLAELDPDARITLIFDSCHSGTATRDLEGGRPRSVDRDSLLATAPAGTRAATPDGLGGAGVDYVLISGARADQQARELSRDGHSYGALTYFLTETLSQTDSALTYVDLRDVVQGEVSSHFGSQSPQLEGTRLNDYVFSDESRLGQPYVRAAPMAEGEGVRLEAGEVHGMTVGSVFDVYAPGTKRFEEPAVPVARVKLTHVGAFTSEAAVVSGGPVGPASRAVEREHVYPNLRMRLRYEGLAASPTLRAVRSALADRSHIEPVGEEDDAFDLRLYEEDGRIHLRHDAVVFSEPVPTSAPDATRRVVDQVEQWAKWFNMRALDDAAPGEPVVLHLRFEDPAADPDAAWNEVSEGTVVWYAFENRSDRDLYLTGVALFSSGAIQPFYPYPPGAAERLRAGTRSREFRLGRLTVPEGRPFTRDLLKVFATTEPVDLSGVLQGAIRGGTDEPSQDPLQALLAQAAQGGTRDFAPEPVGEWYVTNRAYVIRPTAPPQ